MFSSTPRWATTWGHSEHSEWQTTEWLFVACYIVVCCLLLVVRCLLLVACCVFVCLLVYLFVVSCWSLHNTSKWIAGSPPFWGNWIRGTFLITSLLNDHRAVSQLCVSYCSDCFFVVSCCLWSFLEHSTKAKIPLFVADTWSRKRSSQEHPNMFPLLSFGSTLLFFGGF